MKSIIAMTLIATSLTSIQGQAQTLDQPYSLESGKYSLECWTTTRIRNEDGSIRHSTSYQKGEDIVVKDGNVSTETFSLRNEKGTLLVTQTSKTTTTDLGNGFFSQKIENSFEGKSVTYDLKIKVVGNITQFISAESAGQSRDVRGREFSWQKMADGRVVTQNYFVTELPNKIGSSHVTAMCLFSR